MKLIYLLLWKPFVSILSPLLRLQNLFWSIFLPVCSQKEACGQSLEVCLLFSFFYSFFSYFFSLDRWEIYPISFQSYLDQLKSFAFLGQQSFHWRKSLCSGRNDNPCTTRQFSFWLEIENALGVWSPTYKIYHQEVYFFILNLYSPYLFLLFRKNYRIFSIL